MHMCVCVVVARSHRLCGPCARHKNGPTKARFKSVAVHPDEAVQPVQGRQGAGETRRRGGQGEGDRQGGARGLAKCKYTLAREYIVTNIEIYTDTKQFDVYILHRGVVPGLIYAPVIVAPNKCSSLWGPRRALRARACNKNTPHTANTPRYIRRCCTPCAQTAHKCAPYARLRARGLGQYFKLTCAIWDRVLGIR